MHKSLTFRPLTKDFPSSVGLPLPGAFRAAFGSDESFQVKVVFLDRVATVVDAHVYIAESRTSMDLEYIHGFQIWEAKAHSLAMSLKQYPTIKDISVVYAKTLSFDYLARSHPMSDIGQRAAGYAADCTAFQEMLETLLGSPNSQETPPKTQNPDIALDSCIKPVVYVPHHGFLDTFNAYSVGRCFSTTENGYMGWVP